MGVHRTQGVSFPRSGHEVVYQLLERYFGEELVYCDPEHRSKAPRCCACGQVPCANPANNFAKNHDFGLQDGPGMELRSDARYLVQFRSPVRSIASNFHLHVTGYPRDNTRYGWTRFAYCQMEYWNAFIDKWVLAHADDLRFLQCSYEDLVGEPARSLTRVVSHTSTTPPDASRIKACVEAVGVRAFDRLRAFPFYDEDFFGRLQALAGDRIIRLGLPPFDQGV